MRRSEIAHLHPNIRYSFEELRTWTEELDADHAASPGPRRPWAGRRDDGPPRGSAERVAEGCSFIAHTRDDAANLPEPDWTAMLTVVARCEDGEAVAHAWSSPYAGYSHAETQAKFEHAREEMSPRTCAVIGEGCASCPHKGEIKSPVVLREPPVHETKRAIVDAVLSAEDPHGRGVRVPRRRQVGAAGAI